MSLKNASDRTGQSEEIGLASCGPGQRSSFADKFLFPQYAIGRRCRVFEALEESASPLRGMDWFFGSRSVAKESPC